MHEVKNREDVKFEDPSESVIRKCVSVLFIPSPGSRVIERSTHKNSKGKIVDLWQFIVSD